MQIVFLCLLINTKVKRSYYNLSYIITVIIGKTIHKRKIAILSSNVTKVKTSIGYLLWDKKGAATIALSRCHCYRSWTKAKVLENLCLFPAMESFMSHSASLFPSNNFNQIRIARFVWNCAWMILKGLVTFFEWILVLMPNGWS